MAISFPETQTPTPERWAEIQALLRAPFKVRKLSFRPLRKAGMNYEVAVYVDKLAVAERLDAVVGPQNWSYTFTPVVLDLVPFKENKDATPVDLREMTRAKGTLCLFGIPREALGTSSKTEPSKGCDSDTFKRAAVMWGIGAYFYQLKGLTVPASEVKYGKIDFEAQNRLRRQVLAMQPQPDEPKPVPVSFTPAAATSVVEPTAEEPEAIVNESEDAYEDADEDPSNAFDDVDEPPVEPQEPEEPEAPAEPQAPAKPASPEPPALPEPPTEPELQQATPERALALQEFQAAVKEMDLKVGPKMNAVMNYALAQYLGVPTSQAGLRFRTPAQITQMAADIRDKKLTWSPPNEPTE